MEQTFFIPLIAHSAHKPMKRKRARQIEIRKALPVVFMEGVNYGNRKFHLDIVFFRNDVEMAPDIDNMLKYVLDAIKYTIIPDDKYVRSLSARIEEASEGKPHGIEIKVKEI